MPGIASIVVGNGIKRIEPNGLGVIGDRLVVILFVMPGDATTIEWVGSIRIESGAEKVSGTESHSTREFLFDRFLKPYLPPIDS